MRVALALILLVTAACGGSKEEIGGPVKIKESPPAVPAERDCAGLAKHIDRLTAAETEEIRRTRPPDVAPLAEASLVKARTALREVLPKLCESDAYSGEYTACVARATTADGARACQKLLTQVQSDHLTAELATALADKQGVTGVAECDTYIAMIRKLGTCDKMPAASRDAMQSAIDQSLDSWKTMLSTPESRDAVASACKSGVDALKQASASLGCEL